MDCTVDLRVKTSWSGRNGKTVVLQIWKMAYTLLGRTHLNISWMRCRFFDDTFLPGCNKCAVYGHLEKFCRSSDTRCSVFWRTLLQTVLPPPLLLGVQKAQLWQWRGHGHPPCLLFPWLPELHQSRWRGGQTHPCHLWVDPQEGIFFNKHKHATLQKNAKQHEHC